MIRKYVLRKQIKSLPYQSLLDIFKKMSSFPRKIYGSFFTPVPAAVSPPPQILWKAYLAAQSGDLASVKALVEQNPDWLKFNTIIRYGYTIAHVATMSRRWDIVAWCVKKWPDVCNMKEPCGQTVMLCAAMGNCPPELMQLMLRTKGDPNISRNSDGINSLHAAAGADKSPGAQVVQLLLRQDQVDINQRGNDGWRAIFYAIASDNLPAAKALCSDSRIDLRIQDLKKRSVLHSCLKHYDGEEIERPRMIPPLKPSQM